MARTASPLRYPGGKSSLLKLISDLLRENKLDRGHYAEPFAGGAGLALSLLFKGDVGEIHLNDIDPAISALWRAILTDTDELVETMHAAPVTMEERAKQREIYFAKPDNHVALGFSALFLNRVNRSGIIRTGGAIGGVKQGGTYRLDCRFNKQDLERRIRRIAKYKSRIHFSSLDAGDFLHVLTARLPSRSLIYADPPYFHKGAELYTSSFRKEDHAEFRDKLLAVQHPWVLTYDDTPEIRKLYASRRQFSLELYYSAQVKRTGNELLVASKGLKAPISVRNNQIHRPQYRKHVQIACKPNLDIDTTV